MTLHFSREHTLVYDGITLLPFTDACASWHVPGGEIVPTAELIHRAILRGVTVVRRDVGAFGVRVHLLN